MTTLDDYPNARERAERRARLDVWDIPDSIRTAMRTNLADLLALAEEAKPVAARFRRLTFERHAVCDRAQHVMEAQWEALADRPDERGPGVDATEMPDLVMAGEIENWFCAVFTSELNAMSEPPDAPVLDLDQMVSEMRDLIHEFAPRWALPSGDSTGWTINTNPPGSPAPRHAAGPDPWKDQTLERLTELEGHTRRLVALSAGFLAGYDRVQEQRHRLNEPPAAGDPWAQDIQARLDDLDRLMGLTSASCAGIAAGADAVAKRAAERPAPPTAAIKRRPATTEGGAR